VRNREKEKERERETEEEGGRGTPCVHTWNPRTLSISSLPSRKAKGVDACESSEKSKGARSFVSDTHYCA